MKTYTFCKEIDNKKYFLSDFFLNKDLNKDSDVFELKMREHIDFSYSQKSNYVLIIKNNNEIEDVIYFKSLEKMKETFIKISEVYTKALEERFHLLDNLQEEELKNYEFN